jgi:hypothetical protein
MASTRAVGQLRRLGGVQIRSSPSPRPGTTYIAAHGRTIDAVRRVGGDWHNRYECLIRRMPNGTLNGYGTGGHDEPVVLGTGRELAGDGWQVKRGRTLLGTARQTVPGTWIIATPNDKPVSIARGADGGPAAVAQLALLHHVCDSDRL